MKIIEPKAELFDFVDTEATMKKLEKFGRVSHQSGGRPLHTYGAKKRTEEFVRMLIKKGHESVLEHVSLTFHIICDRGVSHELVRHRFASPTQESTRYVKYDGIEVAEPPFKNQDSHIIFDCAMDVAENAYRKLLEYGEPPEFARAVLPHAIKTELYVTASLREWRHILKLRTDKAAHPQMRELMNQVLAVFKEKLPVIVEDIGNE